MDQKQLIGDHFQRQHFSLFCGSVMSSCGKADHFNFLQ